MNLGCADFLPVPPSELGTEPCDTVLSAGQRKVFDFSQCGAIERLTQNTALEKLTWIEMWTKPMGQVWPLEGKSWDAQPGGIIALEREMKQEHFCHSEVVES